jgi:hypothetical protein
MAAFSVWVVRGASVLGVFIVSFSRALRDEAERASEAGEPGWVAASDELFGARPACEGGIGGDSALAWRRLGPPADYPCPEQCPVLVPGGRLGNGVAAALHSVSVTAGLRRRRRPEGRPGRWPACCGRGAPPGRGAARRRSPTTERYLALAEQQSASVQGGGAGSSRSFSVSRGCCTRASVGTPRRRPGGRSTEDAGDSCASSYSPA